MRLYETHRAAAVIFLVYIAEAHPVDGWQTASNEEEGIRLRQHETFEARCAAARLCAARLGLGIPTLVDGMDDAAAEAFSAWPERIYIVGADGRIAFRGGPGPYEFDPDEASAALERLLMREGAPGRYSPR